MEPEIIVTLVHGTFASSAEWIAPDSALSRKLKDRFDETLLVQPFRWPPANNNIWTRLAAAEALASSLKKLQETYPNANQYIIAHSHGGNIALLASRYLDQLNSQSKPIFGGIACLYTPFLHASIRDLSQLTMINMNIALTTILVPLGFFLLTLFGVLSPWSSVIWQALSFVLVGVLVAIISGRAERFVDSQGITPDVCRDAIEAYAPPNLNLLIIRSAGDEASQALDTAQLISRYSSMIFNRMSEKRINPSWRSKKYVVWLQRKGWIEESQAQLLAAYSVRRRNSKILWIEWICYLALLIALYLEYGFANLSEPMLAGAIILGTIVIIDSLTSIIDAFLYPTAFLFLTLVSTLGITSWGTIPPNRTDGSFRLRLGIGLATALLVEVTAEAAPRGEWPITQMGHDITGVQVSRGLRHSIYEDDRVHKRLIDWLEWSEISTRVLRHRVAKSQTLES